VFRPYRDRLLAPDERVTLITRPHPLTFWLGSAQGVFLALLLLAAAFGIEQFRLLPSQAAGARPYLTLALLVGGTIAALSVVSGWVRWRTHEIVVTDRRVVRITGILAKEVSDYSLDAISDLRLRQSWLGRLFDYGDVDVLTAAEEIERPRDTFPVVSGPIRFMHAVQAERERRRQRQVTIVDPRLTDTHPLPTIEPR